ncbi:MAG: methylated-DNA--[protein]-cysteine S-methyltransferase [Candidatus Limnocylindria bacterium]
MTDLERRLGNPPEAVLDHDRLAESLAARASGAGLLDIAYAAMDSPVGELTVFVTPRGLVRLAYENEPLEQAMAELVERVSPRILRAPARTDAARREIEAYFRGSLRAFGLAIDWSLVRGFAGNVLRAAAEVPFGKVTTYGRLAAKAGSPRAARAAGNALGSNPIPVVVPCHRVLHADGSLGGYSGGIQRKRFLLELEGTLPTSVP